MVNYQGGGLYSTGGASNPVLISAEFSGNSSGGTFGGSGGGGVYNVSYSKLVIINSSVMENSADTQGGGIYTERADSVLVNVLIAGNKTFGTLTGSGAGMHNIGTSVDPVNVALINVTLANNQLAYTGPQQRGSAIHSLGKVSALFANTIVWRNSGGTAAVINIVTASYFPTVDYQSCMIEGWLDTDMGNSSEPYHATAGSAGNTSSTDPQFSSNYHLTAATPPNIVNNGNNSKYPADADSTIFGTALSSHPLFSDTVIVKDGMTFKQYITDALTQDQAGAPRFNGGAIDLGAYEY
jgi:predicted outer membrane repeat protein